MKKIRMWISIANDHFGYSLFIYLFTVGVSTCNITSNNRVDINIYTLLYHIGYICLSKVYITRLSAVLWWWMYVVAVTQWGVL